MVGDKRELRMTLGNSGEERGSAGGEKHDRKARLRGRRPEPVGRPVGKPCGLLTDKVEPHAEHARLTSESRKALCSVRFVQRDAGHYGEASRIALYRLLRIIEPLAFE